MAIRNLKIGLLGCGTVGSGFVELLARNDALIRQRTGVSLSISKILVRDLSKKRPGVDHDLLTTQPERVLNNGCDLVVELVGGVEPARAFVQHALRRGKHVVTANKALLASHGFSLMKTAETQKVRLEFEGSVCGGVPIIRALRSGLAGNHIQSINGILNGTCNYILTRMTDDRVEFAEALREAQVKGFAEADPGLDIDGHDAAQKLKILAELAHNTRLDQDAVEVRGIREITAGDILAAHEQGCIIKHLATAELQDGKLSLSVAPVFLPRSHSLASVREENNAVLIRGDAVGDMLFSGKGAGSLPSASAVLSDVMDIACNAGAFPANRGSNLRADRQPRSSRFYLRFSVSDPSAIGPITTVLERNCVPVRRAAAVWSRSGSSQHQVRLFTEIAARSKVDDSLLEITAAGLSAGNGIALRYMA
ncbi:MAG TPA: homoserine dehydrogenase [Terriglobales bacterium]|nr:homoserine dehydrogenase [Terriglobales bacterium]